MTARSKTESKQDQFLTLLTQFYCGLTVRKDMHNISCQIRQFVMSNKNIKNKDQTAKRILDFFLNIESKLKKKNDREWDHAFQITTARGHALLKMCNFPSRNLTLFAFNHLKRTLNLQKQQILSYTINIPQSASGHKDQYSNIQVQKDIKLKTNYFQKWCQYVQRSKILKQLKKRDVQNQKISLSFNKYGTKFNYFTAWKKLYKKHKSQLQKSRIIQKNSKDNLLRSCLIKMQQVSSIIAFQLQLTKKIKKRLIQCKKKSLFKKLRINNQRIKQHVKYNFKKNYKITNKQVFVFLRHLFQNIKPLMNKSYKESRIKFTKNQQKTLLTKYYKQLLSLYNQSKQKYNKIILRNKHTNLRNWKNLYTKNIHIQQKQQTVSNYLLSKRKSSVLTILNFNKLVSQRQFNKLQILKQNPVTNRSFIFANIKKQIQQKEGVLGKYLVCRSIKLFCNNLKEYHDSIRCKAAHGNKTKRIYFLRLLLRWKQYTAKRNQKWQYYKNLQQSYIRKVTSQTFRKWRKIKYYHKVQENSLINMDKCCRKVAMSKFWNKFVLRIKQKQCITKLVQSSTHVLIKIAYNKLFWQSKCINQCIKFKVQQNNNKITKRLFNLLVQNLSYNSKMAENINKVTVKKWQCIMLKRLRSLQQLKLNTNKTVKLLQNIRIKQLISKISTNYKQKRTLKQKLLRISKTLFIHYLQSSLKKSLNLQSTVKSNTKKIKQKLRLRQISTFIDQLHYNIHSRQQISLRIKKIRQNRIYTNLLKIRKYYQQVQYNKNIASSSQVIILRKKTDTIRYMNVKNKSKILNEYLSTSRKGSGFRDLRQLCSNISQQKQFNCMLNDRLSTKCKKQFYKYLELDKKQMDVKINKLQTHQESHAKGQIWLFLSLLKADRQNIGNRQKLLQIRKNKLFSQFIAMHLRSKFHKIKFNCSLKSYAKTLIKKAFIGLKQNRMKLRQKQNLIKLDRTSSIVIQRSIEKSFKSNTLSEQIQRFNLRKSRQIRG